MTQSDPSRAALADELLPCPFCGGKPAFERHGTNRQSCIIACQDCGCRVETGETWNEGIVWNTRASLPGRLDCGAVADELCRPFHEIPVHQHAPLLKQAGETIRELLRAPLPPTLNRGAAEGQVTGTDICPCCGFKMCRCTPEDAEIPRIARPAFEALYEKVGIKNFWRQYRFWPGKHAPLNNDWKLRKQSGLISADDDGKTYHDPRQESHWQIYREGWLAGRERERELERCKAANALPRAVEGGAVPLNVDLIAAAVHEGRFPEGRAQINYCVFEDERKFGKEYCRRIARSVIAALSRPNTGDGK